MFKDSKGCLGFRVQGVGLRFTHVTPNPKSKRVRQVTPYKVDHN